MLKTYIILFLLIPINNTDPIEKGNQAFEEGDFKTALINYSLVLYRSKHDEIDPITKKELLLKATFSSSMLNYDEAVLSLSEQLTAFQQDPKNNIDFGVDTNISMLVNIISMLSETEINPNNALIHAINFRPSTHEQEKYQYLLIANAHLKNRNINRFKEYYSSFCSLEPCIKLTNEKPDQKNEKTARRMSLILPGSGQIYAKNYPSGIGAIALTGLGAYLTGKAAGEERYIDAGIIGVLLFYRYYIGNIEEAANSVTEFNTSQNSKLYDQFFETLEVEIGFLKETIYHSILHIPFSSFQ